MAFDPSVLSQIGEQPDIGGAMAKGFQLKDLINQNTLSGIEVQKAKKEQEQSSFLSGLSKEFDITKPEQASKAASKAAKAGYPDLATGVLKQSQSLQLGQAQIEEQRFQIGMQAQTRIDEGVQGILASVNAQTSGPDGKPLRTPQGTEKYDSKTKDAMTLAGVLKMKRDLEDDETMSPEAKKMALAEVNKYLASGQPVTYDGINQVARATKTGREAFDKEIERRNKLSEMKTREEGLQERTRHDLATEKVAGERAKAQTEGFGGKSGELMAALAERGVSLPAGFRSKAQQEAMLSALVARHPDKSVDEIADDIKSGRLKLAAETKGAQVAGGQIGKVALASNELDTFGDQVLEASRGLPRTVSMTLNGIMQAGDKELSDPRLIRLKTKLQALNNAYDQLSARGGTDKDKRAHVHELFNQKLSDAGIQELVRSVKEEAEGARQAANRTIAETSGTSIPGTGSADKPSAVSEPTATGPNGQKVVYRGGKWVPLGQ